MIATPRGLTMDSAQRRRKGNLDMRATKSRAAAAVLTVSTVLLTGSGTADASSVPVNPISHCGWDAQGKRGYEPKYTAPVWQARGNYIDTWPAPYGIENEDAFRLTASGTTRIDYWGANKDVAGDAGIAPLGWPLPGERQYMLMARVTTGRIWLNDRWRWYNANQWFPVGADSGCLAYDSLGQRSPELQFGINDTNIGDNGGGPSVSVRQWWGWYE